MRTVHAEPPDQRIWRDVGDLSKIEIFGQNVLIATYIRPKEIALGESGATLELPDQTIAEDRYQAKVGMLLKLGPRAFVDEPPNVLFYDIERSQPGAPKPGDWVVFRPSDSSFSFQVGGHHCRLIPDVFVKMRLGTPDEVY